MIPFIEDAKDAVIAKLGLLSEDVASKLDGTESTVQSKLDTAKAAQDAALAAARKAQDEAMATQAQEIEALKAVVERGAIKSVQRGITAIHTGSGNSAYQYSTSVTLSSVNVSKCVVLASVHVGGNNSGQTGQSYQYRGIGATLGNSTTLNLSGYGNTYISWQVIEFY